MTTTAEISKKGCSGTGITEELADRLHDQLGKKVLAIVELVSESRAEKRNGDQKVTLSVLTIEPIGDNDSVDEHVRNIQAALYRNRKLAESGPELPLDSDDGPAPAVADILAQGKGLIDVDDDGEPVLWDGNTDPDDDGQAADEPHAYVDTAFATCGHQGCGQPAGSAIHDTDDLEPQPA